MTRSSGARRRRYTRSVARKKRVFDIKKEVRKLARERVGTVPSGGPIIPKSERKKPKHKRALTAEETGAD